ncbi:MAG: methyltransferase [Candidatus Magnetomorum sp.]|nr:methyltransferase [Candidatus Magnetomorum sp.]
MFSIQAFKQTYETEEVSLSIRDKQFSFFIPKDLDPFINQADVLHHFPLWAKIWEASLVLADYLAGQNQSSKKILELGAGLGAIGIIAASFGHNVTLTEYDPHALQFIQANAHINSCDTIDIKLLDWHDPKLDGKFDMIVGSELIYKDSDFSPLVALFHKYLSDEGEIFLANEPRKASKPFLDMMVQWYTIQVWRKQLRAKDEKKTILLTRLTEKNKKVVQ